MTCSRPFSIDVGPGVLWQDMTWELVTLQQDGTGTAVWDFPGDGGTGNSWQGSTSASAGPGTDLGRLTIRGTMIYAGPNRSCRAVLTVSNNNDTSGGLGGNSSSINYFLNSILQSGATMPLPPPTFNGEYTLDFTAQAGTMEFLIDMLSNSPGGSQPLPMTITVSGTIINL